MQLPKQEFVQSFKRKGPRYGRTTIYQDMVIYLNLQAGEGESYATTEEPRGNSGKLVIVDGKLGEGPGGSLKT